MIIICYAVTKKFKISSIIRIAKGVDGDVGLFLEASLASKIEAEEPPAKV